MISNWGNRIILNHYVVYNSTFRMGLQCRTVSAFQQMRRILENFLSLLPQTKPRFISVQLWLLQPWTERFHATCNSWCAGQARHGLGRWVRCCTQCSSFDEDGMRVEHWLWFAKNVDYSAIQELFVGHEQLVTICCGAVR